MTIVKFLFLYLGYKLFIYYIKNYCKKHNHPGSAITNCITFTCCKEKTNKVSPALPIVVTYDSVSKEVNNEEPVTPRKSVRLANLILRISIVFLAYILTLP